MPIIGGWSQNLNQKPLRIFDVCMYGMVTNLNSLTTGGCWNPGNVSAPNFSGRNSQILWTYGGEGCSPSSKPSSSSEVNRIVQATKDGDWDGVDFDDECNMNIDYVIQAMGKLQNIGKDTSYGFISGWDYNNPGSCSQGQRLNYNVRKLAEAGVCDRLILYCYGDQMWSMSDIKTNVRKAINTSISNGMPRKKIILALTTAGLNDDKLHQFLYLVTECRIGGLFIWGYENLSSHHKNIIINVLHRD